LKIAVLIATYNRVAITLTGLASLFDAINAQSAATFEVFLLDDASPDGTADAVRAHFPQVHVIDGTGNLWWVRGMDVAYRAARAAGTDWDAYLLYNDDVQLRPDALGEMVQTFTKLNDEGRAALYGPMCTSTGRPSYPGRSINPRHNPLWKPFAPRLLMETPPNGTLRTCDTFHANCLMVPGDLMDRLGGMDPAFLHRHGDTDLGFRLARLGCRNLVMPDYVGVCELNDPFPIAPTILSRFWQQLNPPNPLSDELRLVFRYYPFPVAVGNAIIRILYLFRNALRPTRAPMTMEQWRSRGQPRKLEEA
jgi:GT2 family glycosyltransferase